MDAQVLTQDTRIGLHERHDLLPLEGLDLPLHVHIMIYLIFIVLSLEFLEISSDLSVRQHGKAMGSHDALLEDESLFNIDEARSYGINEVLPVHSLVGPVSLNEGLVEGCLVFGGL